MENTQEKQKFDKSLFQSYIDKFSDEALQKAKRLIEAKLFLRGINKLITTINNGWECKSSPSGYCDYEQEDGTFDEDCCRYCGDPEERK